jgi:hypothetical protein
MPTPMNPEPSTTSVPPATDPTKATRGLFGVLGPPLSNVSVAVSPDQTRSAHVPLSSKVVVVVLLMVNVCALVGGVPMPSSSVHDPAPLIPIVVVEGVAFKFGEKSSVYSMMQPP